jgi:hypothetical protein
MLNLICLNGYHVIPAKAGGALQQQSWSSSGFGVDSSDIARSLAYAAGV